MAYIELVENLHDPILDQFMKDEFDVLQNVLCIKECNVVELGAGYGRVVKRIEKYAKRIIAIEINPAMYSALKFNCIFTSHVKCIKNDITKLSEFLVLESKVKTVFLLCQNTLGVIEGDFKEMISEILKVSKGKKAEVIISVFNKAALENFGVLMYAKMQEMIGELDPIKSSFNDGIFVSKEGYISKWWSSGEMIDVITLLRAKIISMKTAQEYTIYHLEIFEL